MHLSNAERNGSKPEDDSNLVDEMLGFLEEEGASQGAAPGAFKASFKLIQINKQVSLSETTSLTHMPVSTQELEDQRTHAMCDGGMDPAVQPGLQLHCDGEDISQYKFSKFAAKYFQSNESHTYIRRAIKSPPLALKDDGDQMVRISLQLSRFPFTLFLSASTAQNVYLWLLHHRLPWLSGLPSYDSWVTYRNSRTMSPGLKQRFA